MDVSTALAQADRLRQQGDFAAALGACDQILMQNSGAAEAHMLRAHALIALQRPEDAVAALGHLLAIQPTSAAALILRGETRMTLGQFARALEDFDLAAALDVDATYAQGTALYLALRICRWDGFADAVEDLHARVRAADAVIKPYHFLALPASSQLQRKCAADFYRDTTGVEEGQVPAAGPTDKIRLGYFSADFRAHATAHLIAGLLRAHDRTKFEVVAFSLSGDPRDPVQRLMKGSVDRWIDISPMSDDAAVASARALGIHIALDLNVYLHRQPALFARRVAPIQVGYLGYPGTSAADCYDYLIGDSIVTPLAHAADFSERLVLLPGAYQPTNFRTLPPLKVPARAALGLPEQGFIFCCFNDSFKITPDVFDIWMRLLLAVEGSVLWLLAPNDIAMRNLRAEAGKRGVLPERLIFAPRVSLQDYIARQGAADLFLDTFHYNAHTTASDALWAGLPLLTCIGETFASRVAASLLTAAGLPDLIAANAVDYEKMALELATQPDKLKQLRAKLQNNKLTCALFDTARYTRNLEAAYLQMWERSAAGLAPDHITVTDDYIP